MNPDLQKIIATVESMRKTAAEQGKSLEILRRSVEDKHSTLQVKISKSAGTMTAAVRTSEDNICKEMGVIRGRVDQLEENQQLLREEGMERDRRLDEGANASLAWKRP